MGMQTMNVQPSTQPTGKGGFRPPQSPSGFMGDASAMDVLQNKRAAIGQNVDVSQMQSAMTGQPRFGQPNQYAQTMGWDKAQFGAGPVGNASFPQGKGQSSGKGQANQPFVAPTQFPVANQFNTQPAPVQEEQKPQSPAYVGSEGYNAGGAD